MAKDHDPAAQRFRERQDREKDYEKQLPSEDDQPLPVPVEPIQSSDKPNRNDPCHCGSGKKYKRCCGTKNG